jgi:CO/xanthine dehydrogenase FAD-binding subunit
MTRFVRPSSLAEACETKAAEPGLLPVAGGTDVMVGLNSGRTQPVGLLDLRGVAELRRWWLDGESVRVGAGLTYTRIVDELATLAPALAMAARTVGSRQIRNRATLGGNLVTSSPAGDGLPPLVATGCDVELVSARGTRTVAVTDFFTGPKRNVLGPDELVAAVRVPVRRGPQQFSKVGPRNAMVIAVASVATALDAGARSVGVGIGAVAPVPLRAQEAGRFAAAELDWDGGAPIGSGVAARFGALVAGACAPIDDVRSTAAYRRHAVGVLAARSLSWTWDEYRRGEACG